MISIEVTHQAACTTTGCSNFGIVYDLASLNGNLMQIICGGCGQDFTANATPKE